jgi:hypothetical protein
MGDQTKEDGIRMEINSSKKRTKWLLALEQTTVGGTQNN